MSGPLASTILIVDDSDTNRYTVGRYLRRAGYQTLEAANGREALRLADSKPDLVILDIQLPDIVGYEVCRLLKTNARTAWIPVLHLSATFTASVDKVRGLEFGADGYLTEPIDPDELLANVKVLLRLKETQDRLRNTNEKLSSVLASITDLYFSLDPNWRFLSVNPRAEEFFQHPASELIGKVIWEEFPGAEELDCFRQFQLAMTEQRPVHFEGRLGATDRWFEAHAYFRDRELEVYLRDITERKNAEDALKRTAAELQKTQSKLTEHNQLLEEKVARRTAKLRETVAELKAFSYSVTHDMRAPLRGMQGFAKILLDEYAPKLDRTGVRHLQRIMSSANRLDLLIQDVLSYSQIVQADLPLHSVDLDQLLRDLIAEHPDFQPPLAEFAIAGQIPPVLGNLAFLTQAFSNLFRNAVQFTKTGTVPRVQIEAEPASEFIRVWVRDNGIGIDPRHRERIFKIFERLHSQREFPGTGIGLAIAHKAIERLGGRIGVESEPGQGSRFWIDLHPSPPSR